MPNVALDLTLTAVNGETRPVQEWVTTFHLASVVLDPYTNESSWILDTACRVLDAFRGAAVRVNFVLTCSPEEAKQFMGPLANEYLVFCDPDRSFTRSLGVATLPTFAFVRSDGEVITTAEGWNPAEWRAVARSIATTCSWSAPVIPMASDPTPFHGTPVQG